MARCQIVNDDKLHFATVGVVLGHIPDSLKQFYLLPTMDIALTSLRA